MDITEMHTLFRQLSQQMGLQNVRGILPEQIDLLLNTSILDILKQIINTNVGLTTSNGIFTNSKIGQINSLKTLYKKESVSFEYDEDSNNYKLNTFVESDKDILSAFYIVDCSVRYKNLEGTYKTKYYPVRFIDSEYADIAITDPILKPTIINPLIIKSSNCNIIFNASANAQQVLEGKYVIDDIKIGYINKPCSVNILENKSSDMPEQHHIDIVKHAVEMYLYSIGVGQRVETNNRNN